MCIKPILVLVTGNYPFEANQGEVPFVRPEVRRLAMVFDHVIVVPLNPYGRNLDPSMPAQLDLSLAEQFHRNRMTRALSGLNNESFWAELPRALKQAGLRGGRRVLSWSVANGVAKSWTRRRFHAEDNVLFYTYWRTGVTLGLINASRNRPGWKVVTRVHGYDLYPERYNPPYQPFSPGMYNDLNKTYTISKVGMDYLTSLGVARERIVLAQLGVEDPGFLCEPSRDNVFRIVSCSFITPVKRVPLLAQGIVAFAQKNPSAYIQWTHLGDGQEKEQVLKEIKDVPDNLQVRLLGHIENNEVFNFYQSNYCDVFVHASASEGLPVAMQEASAVGIPILTTDVGGVSEIVTPKNGKLLPTNPSLDDIVHGLEWFAALSEEDRDALRKGARAVWEHSFNAEKNHMKFARRLLESWQGTGGESYVH